MIKPRLHFDFGSIFQRTKHYVDHYNAQQSKLTDKLNASHRATAELIMRLYTKQLNQAAQLQELNMHSLPGFRTFNASLAACKGCTKRTIANHKERLKQSGFIVREEHRGSEGIELWINPEIFGKPMLSTIPIEGVTKISAVASLFYGDEKNFHPLVHEQQEQNNNNSKVDMLMTDKQKEKSGFPCGHRSGLSEAAAPLIPSDEPTGTKQEQDMNTGKNVPSVPKRQKSVAEKSNIADQQEPVTAGSRQTGSRPGGESTVDAAQTGSRQTGRCHAGAEHISLLNLVREFWQYTRRILYPSLLLSDPEEREILNHIWASVYKKFCIRGTLKEWNDYQDILYRRVEMVRRWLDRDPSHWIPKPRLYFHPHNTKNGFDKTWEWYVKQETLKREVRNQLLIQQTQHEWKLYDQGKGRHQHKTRLQLFRIQQKRLSQYRDEALMQVYHASLQQSLHLENISRHAI